MIQMGFPPKKKIFGADISGIVEAVGKNVKKFKMGDHVIGDTSDHGFGGFAEYVAAPEKAFIHKPEELSFEEAAALPLAAITALQALRDKGGVKKDSQVLIIGSSGGVGIYALQIAKYYGAIVTGVCSSQK
jgi:NADPH:quinone reductase-like Zn-dependent oxidoreductase